MRLKFLIKKFWYKYILRRPLWPIGRVMDYLRCLTPPLRDVDKDKLKEHIDLLISEIVDELEMLKNQNNVVITIGKE